MSPERKQTASVPPYVPHFTPANYGSFFLAGQHSIPRLKPTESTDMPVLLLGALCATYAHPLLADAQPCMLTFFSL
jgi:hypothetical protein